MVEDLSGPPFPVVFFDGERQIEIGTVEVNPMMSFKAFQLMISQRIGISPNQISIYLCDRKTERKRIPITGKVNFAFIAREEDCFFLAVLKRSRKSRNRKAKMNDYSDYLADSDYYVPSPPILLRRNLSLNPSDLMFSRYAQFGGFDDRLQNLMIQRQNFAMAMSRPNPNLDLDPEAFPRIQDSYKNRAACKECIKTTAFHLCVNDPVLDSGWFRTRVGPISRPN